jgi:hypothetical protein
VVDAYFPFGSPIGENLEIGGRIFRVIGVLEKREQLFGGGGGSNDQNNVIYMPIGSALRLKPFADDLFLLAVAREGQLDKAKDEVQDLLRVRRQVHLERKTISEWKLPPALSNSFSQLRRARR